MPRSLALLAATALFCLPLLASPPNILLLLSDDQGYPDLGCIGSKPILTPNLDRLASEGVRATSFYAAVTRMDRVIGQLLDALDAAGQTDHTLVIFLSGNGGNAPLRSSKSTMWEGGLRVPFLIRWPGHLPAGHVSDEFLSSLKIVPTLLAATGAPAPQDVALDGFDMLPVLRRDIPSPRTSLFWQRRSEKAARVNHWKWVESSQGNGLFDLSQDPGETTGLSAQKPDIAQNMRDGSEAWRRSLDETEPRGPFRDY